VRRKILRRGSVRIGLAFVRGFRVRLLLRGRLRFLVTFFQALAFGGLRFVMRSMLLIHVMIFGRVVLLPLRLVVVSRGASQRFTRQDFHRRAYGSRQGWGRALRLLVRMYGIVVFEVFKDVADVQERIAIETDVHEGGLHAGKDAGDFSFVDAADQRELFLALDVDLD